MNEELFRIIDVRAGYGKNSFIGGLNLSVKRGDFISFIGPNGAGKSTIIKLLSGLLVPFDGRVEFMGKDVRDIRGRELARNFSVVGQLSGDLPEFKVKSFISLGRFPFLDILEGNYTDESHLEMALKTGVTHLMERTIRELSAGELQLVQITRALVQNSNVLLLDEPVSNLDYFHITGVMDILKELHSGGATIICALHDVNAALNYCSRVIAVKNGAVLFEGSPESVINESAMRGLYGTDFFCGVNPVTGRPLVLPVPGASG